VLVTDEIIKNVAHSARVHGSASASHKCSDTVKIVDYAKKTKLDEMLDREYIYLMQTPQIFRTEIYRAAAYVARENNFEGTDDCSLVENIGMQCQLVECGAENIKVTTPIDFTIAEAIIAHRLQMKNAEFIEKDEEKV